MRRALLIALLAVLVGSSMVAQAYEKGDFVLRLGAVNVDPDADSSDINLPGVDFPFAKNWAITLEVWYIQIDTNATVKTDVGNVHFKTDIDPFVYHVGIAHRL